MVTLETDTAGGRRLFDSLERPLGGDRRADALAVDPAGHTLFSADHKVMQLLLAEPDQAAGRIVGLHDKHANSLRLTREVNQRGSGVRHQPLGLRHDYQVATEV